jgi:6-phospho-3-hexuloisomerase
MTYTLSDLSRGALAELGRVFTRLSDYSSDPLIEAIVAAKRIVVFGCGREGLQMRGFAMRLFHLGATSRSGVT